MKEDPLITICMAAFNASVHIANAINSVILQTWQNWELIVVDDGSSDDTAGVVEKFALSDNRIRLIRQENAGPALARRAAYLSGNGAYFISLDSDDRFSSDSLDILVSDAISTGSDLVMADMMRMDPSSGEWRSFSGERGIRYGQEMTGEEAFGLTFPWVVNGQFLIRREIINSSIGLDNFFNSYNCDEYLTRVYCLKANMVLASKGIYYYESNPSSITQNPTLRRLAFIQTDRMLLKLAVDSGVSTRIIISALSEVDLGLLRFSGLVGYHFGNGSLPVRDIWMHFKEFMASESQFLHEKEKVGDLNQGIFQRWSVNLLRYARFVYWFSRAATAQQAVIVKLKRMVRS